ncbi:MULTISPECIES: AtpZ/AtpI family protein [Chitinophagaceae]
MKKKSSDNKYLLQKYGGLAFQFIGGIAIGVFVGKFLDEKLFHGRYLLIWILPLFFIFLLLYGLIKDVMKK